MEAILASLTSLPSAVLYAILALVAAAENFVPPIPADMVVAFGAFLAARKGESPIPTTVAVVAGNVGGAVAMFWLGRRFGADWIKRRLHLRGESAERRVRGWYARYGVAALFLSRFLPGVRAVVPPLAGAMRVPATGAILAIAAASTIWYVTVAILAYRLGSNWEVIRETIGRFQTWSAIVAGAVVGLALAVWLVRRRLSRS